MKKKKNHKFFFREEKKRKKKAFNSLFLPYFLFFEIRNFLV